MLVAAFQVFSGPGQAIAQTGYVVGWGYNESGQAESYLEGDAIAVAAGSKHSLALVQAAGWQFFCTFGVKFNGDDLTGHTAVCTGNLSALTVPVDPVLLTNPAWGFDAEPDRMQTGVFLPAGGYPLVSMGGRNDGATLPPGTKLVDIQKEAELDAVATGGGKRWVWSATVVPKGNSSVTFFSSRAQLDPDREGVVTGHQDDETGECDVIFVKKGAQSIRAPIWSNGLFLKSDRLIEIFEYACDEETDTRDYMATVED